MVILGVARVGERDRDRVRQILFSRDKTSTVLETLPLVGVLQKGAETPLGQLVPTVEISW